MASNLMAQPMAKKRSSQSIHGPFVNTETAVPPLTLNTWQASHDEPFNFFSTASASSSPPAFKTRRTATGSVPSQASEYSSVSVYEPAEYVKQAQSALSPTSSRCDKSRRNSCQNLSPLSYLSQSPSTQASDEFTNATTLSSIGMSRNDSLGGSSFCGGLAMLKVDSQRSESMMQSDTPTDDLVHTVDSIPRSKSIPIPATESSLSLTQRGSMMEGFGPSSIGRVTDTLKLPLVVEEEDAAMSRTSSTESADASKSRLSRRSQEQVALSTRPIAPKDNPESMSRQSSSSSSFGSEMIHQLSADGSKVAIEKAKYQRPTHEKIKCELCNLKPDGYRGPHELRRHMDNKHGATRKVWICVDRSPDQKFLSNCKQCKEKKTYGAYYNAACHLRRIHWHPREKGKKSDKAGKGRGGNGGGDDPPMEFLKLWMEEIYVSATSDASSFDDIEDNDVADEFAIDDSQDDLDYTSSDPASGQRDIMPPTKDITTTATKTAQNQHQAYLMQASDHELTQANMLMANTFQTSLAPHDNIFSHPTFTFDDDKDGMGAYPASTIPSSAFTRPQSNANSLNPASVNHDFASGNVESTDLSLTSSMNSPIGQLDQLNSFSFDCLF